MASVEFKEITKRYGDHVGVEKVSLKIDHGEFISFVGPSGCGKSTTLRLVAGLERIDEGTLFIGDRLANELPPRRRNVAMVFQSYALFPHMSVEANIGFGLKIRKTPEAQRRNKIDWALDLLGIRELAGRLPRHLSGGERQRVALGRALVLEPDVLLLDEPLSNLDAGLRGTMRTALKRLHQEVRTTVIYVTHDQVEAMTLSDRIAIMKQGRVLQVGAPQQLYRRPRNLFVGGFIGSPPMNQIAAGLRELDSQVVVDTGDFELTPRGFPSELLSSYLNRPLVLGIRPESIRPAAAQGAATLEAVVNLVEPLGGEDILDVNVGNTNLKVKLPAEHGLGAGDAVTLEVDPDGLHLFDRETGESIRPQE